MSLQTILADGIENYTPDEVHAAITELPDYLTPFSIAEITGMDEIRVTEFIQILPQIGMIVPTASGFVVPAPFALNIITQLRPELTAFFVLWYVMQTWPDSGIEFLRHEDMPAVELQ